MRPGLRPDTTGATLVEVSVYSAILLMLLTGVYIVVEGGSRYLRLSRAHQTVNQQLVIALKKVTRELGDASKTNLIAANTPQDHILFLSHEAPLGTTPIYSFTGAQTNWRKWVCFYRTPGNVLVRAEQPLGTETPDPSLPSAPDFLSQIVPLVPQPVARHITDAEFSVVTAPEVIRVEIESERATGTGKATRMRLQSDVRLINP